MSSGVVPEQAGEVAQDREDMGSKQHHGRVRSVRRHGATLAASTGEHPQICQGRRRGLLCSLAAK